MPTTKFSEFPQNEAYKFGGLDKIICRINSKLKDDPNLTPEQCTTEWAELNKRLKNSEANYHVRNSANDTKEMYCLVYFFEDNAKPDITYNNNFNYRLDIKLTGLHPKLAVKLTQVYIDNSNTELRSSHFIQDKKMSDYYQKNQHDTSTYTLYLLKASFIKELIKLFQDGLYFKQFNGKTSSKIM